jgi:hypothetical protein
MPQVAVTHYEEEHELWAYCHKRGTPMNSRFKAWGKNPHPFDELPSRGSEWKEFYEIFDGIHGKSNRATRDWKRFCSKYLGNLPKKCTRAEKEMAALIILRAEAAAGHCPECPNGLR